MRKIMIAVVALAAAPASAADRSFTVTDFDRVEVNGPYKVSLTVGKASSAKAMGSREAVDRIAVEVQGRTLRIRPDASAWGGYPGHAEGAVELVVSTASLSRASVNGSGSLSVDRMRGMKLELLLAGSGSIEIGNVEADVLWLNQLGSGRIKLAGKTKTFRAESHGSGSLDATAMVADDVQIAADSAGPISLIATRSAKVTSTAAGDVEVTGSAACTVTRRGAGNVRCGR